LPGTIVPEHVDRLCRAVEQERGEALDSRRQAQCAGQVVASSGRYDSERAAGRDRRAGNVAHQPVTAHSHDDLAVGGRGRRQLDCMFTAVGHFDPHGCPGVACAFGERRPIPRGVAAAPAGDRVDECGE
jgi:hypothetical protein